MPDVSTEVAIATTTLGSASSTITFSSISSAYTDLRLIFVPIVTTVNVYPVIRFNSDSASNYSWTYMSGNGINGQSGRFSSQGGFYTNIGGSTTIPYLVTFDLFSYTGSTFKTMLWNEVNDKNGSGIISPKVGLWRSTSAITNIEIAADSSTWAAGTTATLYGIL